MAGGRSGSARADELGRAQDACLRLLGVRERSRAELAERLRKREFAEPIVTEALDRLERSGLLDDARFAEQWVRSRHRDGGKARAVLARELRDKGVDEDIAREALEQIDGSAEHDRAHRLVATRLQRTVHAPITDRAERDRLTRRLLGMLARRGYSAGIAHAVVRAALAEHDQRLAGELAPDTGGADDPPW